MLFVAGLAGVIGVSAVALAAQTVIEFFYAKLKGETTQYCFRCAIFALSFPYSVPYVLKMMMTKSKFDYPAVRESFCKYHVNWVNLATHAVGVPLMVYGVLCCMDAAWPGSSRIFAVLYLAMLKAHLPTIEWLYSVIAMAILVGGAAVLPVGWFGVCFGMLNECATQISHDLFEPAYFTEYGNKPWGNFFHCVLEHDFYLLPLCIEACKRQIVPSSTTQKSS